MNDAEDLAAGELRPSGVHDEFDQPQLNDMYWASRTLGEGRWFR